MQAILLAGPIASGKTAVAQEMVEVASELGMSAAAIDLDWLGWSAGGELTMDELIARNLADVAANYAAAKIERLVLARAMVSESGLLLLRQALRGWVLTVASLEASRATLEERVRRRDRGAELEHHLAHLAAGHDRLAGAHVVLNEGKGLRDVANEVMKLGGWV